MCTNIVNKQNTKTKQNKVLTDVDLVVNSDANVIGDIVLTDVGDGIEHIALGGPGGGACGSEVGGGTGAARCEHGRVGGACCALFGTCSVFSYGGQNGLADLVKEEKQKREE